MVFGHSVEDPRCPRIHAHFPNEQVTTAWIYDANVFCEDSKSPCCRHPRQRSPACPAIPDQERRGDQPSDPAKQFDLFKHVSPGKAPAPSATLNARPRGGKLGLIPTSLDNGGRRQLCALRIPCVQSQSTLHGSEGRSRETLKYQCASSFRSVHDTQSG
jgi:hypothetical protein